MKKGIRLDVFLAENKLSESREKAKREILSGWVRVGGETIREPSRIINGREDILVERPGGIFVSRGGEKLQHAMDYFHINVRDRIAADLGASTGGFTDCLLRNGASLVYAIDVGYGQMDYRLRINPAVIVKEKTNVRHLAKADFGRMPDFITVDLSFISILKVWDTVRMVFSPAEGIILVKPQFEAHPGEQKKGVVKKKEYHVKILERVMEQLQGKGMIPRGLTFSPLKGPAGNIEYLLFFSVGRDETDRIPPDHIGSLIESAVNESHEKLNDDREGREG